MIFYIFLTFLLSFFTSIFLIRLAYRYPFLIKETLHSGPQKLHQRPTPRLGGIALFTAFTGALILGILRKERYLHDFILLYFSVIPCFLGGLLEDITAKVGVKGRLFFTLISASLVYYFLNACLFKIDIPFVDHLLKYPLISFIFTIFAITGVTNAFNIIDGLNGLASMVSVIILLSLSFVSYKVGDYFLTTLQLALIGALIGFFLLNYPAGLIFLGDGGAYLVGFLIGTFSVILVNRHPEVSPWFPFLVCIYPVFETLFTMFRRKIIHKRSMSSPDTLHLHSIIFKKLTIKLLGPAADISLRNATTSPFLWAFTMLSIIPAIIFWQDTSKLIISSIAFIFLYLFLYLKLIFHS